MCLYDYLFLFSFGEDQGQQSQSPGEEGPLEGESMSQSVNPDPDPDPWIKPGWELLQLQRNQWDSPRKRHLKFWGWARLVHRTALTSRYLLKHPLPHSHPHCLCCRRKATPYFIEDPSCKTNSKSRRLHVSQHLFSLHVIINPGRCAQQLSGWALDCLGLNPDVVIY